MALKKVIIYQVKLRKHNDKFIEIIHEKVEIKVSKYLVKFKLNSNSKQKSINLTNYVQLFRPLALTQYKMSENKLLLFKVYDFKPTCRTRSATSWRHFSVKVTAFLRTSRESLTPLRVMNIIQLSVI